MLTLHTYHQRIIALKDITPYHLLHLSQSIKNITPLNHITSTLYLSHEQIMFLIEDLGKYLISLYDFTPQQTILQSKYNPTKHKGRVVIADDIVPSNNAQLRRYLSAICTSPSISEAQAQEIINSSYNMTVLNSNTLEFLPTIYSLAKAGRLITNHNATSLEKQLIQIKEELKENRRLTYSHNTYNSEELTSQRQELLYQQQIVTEQLKFIEEHSITFLLNTHPFLAKTILQGINYFSLTLQESVRLIFSALHDTVDNSNQTKTLLKVCLPDSIHRSIDSTTIKDVVLLNRQEFLYSLYYPPAIGELSKLQVRCAIESIKHLVLQPVPLATSYKLLM